jgi:hypothetical protein
MVGAMKKAVVLTMPATWRFVVLISQSIGADGRCGTINDAARRGGEH